MPSLSCLSVLALDLSPGKGYSSFAVGEIRAAFARIFVFCSWLLVSRYRRRSLASFFRRVRLRRSSVIRNIGMLTPPFC